MPVQTLKKSNLTFEQLIPIALTAVIFLSLWGLLFFVIRILNLLPNGAHIALNLRWADILVGAVIYLKTSVDFAVFMGRLQASNPGWQKRIAIEIGTALGNGLGTIGILILWVFFRRLEILLALMILLAALILFELAYSGLEQLANWEGDRGFKRLSFILLDNVLSSITKTAKPLTSRIIPDLGSKLKGDNLMPWKSLLWFAFTVPFILGLDDFAGYVPLFSLVNVFGFALGVMGAHMILNIGLFANPEATIKFFKNQWISFAGTVAFMGLAAFGIIEVLRILI